MIGRMDQRVTFQRFATVADGGGGVTRVWADLTATATVWAAVKSRADGKSRATREATDEGRVNAAYTVEFTIYNRSDLSEIDRLKWNGEVYNIRGIRRTGTRDLRLVIEAERGVAE
jgi:SPP1 family predicted phage head-tail adaptor